MPSTTKPHSSPHQPRSSQDAQRAARQAATTLARHTRKCAICKHPHRAAIDDDFVSWRSESSITLDYQLPSRSSIYRHAAVTGLLQRRRLNLRGVAERILERVDEAPPTAATILRAMRIFAQITEDGQWLEPAKRTIVTHIHITQDSPADAPSAESLPAPVPDPPSNATESACAEEGRACPEACPEEGRACPEERREPTPASPGSRPVANPQPERTTRRQLDYLPRWAAGLPDSEFLIGTQNADPETASSGERST